MRWSTPRSAASATLLALAAPAAAWACPVCFAADRARGQAFFATTWILSLLPLALVGAGAWVLRRAARKR